MSFNPTLIPSFISFVEARNISEAAQNLNVSQPAISLHLQQLERQLGQKLFATQGRRKVLTHFGEIFYRNVKNAWADLGRAVETAHWQAGDITRFHLRIGGRQEILSFLAPKIEFSGSVELRPLTGKSAVSAILERSVDIAVVQTKPDSSDVVAKKLFSNGVIFAVHRSLLKGESLKAQVKNLNWLAQTPALAYKRENSPFLSDWWREIGLNELHPKFVCEDWNVIAEMISQTRGYGIIPDMIALSKSVETIGLDMFKPIDFYVVYRREIAKLFDINALFKN